VYQSRDVHAPWLSGPAGLAAQAWLGADGAGARAGPQRYAQSSVLKRTLFELIAAELLAGMLEASTPEASAHGGASGGGGGGSPLAAARCGPHAAAAAPSRRRLTVAAKPRQVYYSIYCSQHPLSDDICC